MRVYLKSGKSIRIKKKLGREIAKEIFAASENHNPVTYVRLSDNSLLIRVDEIDFIK